jgi:hypothetical protein
MTRTFLGRDIVPSDSVSSVASLNQTTLLRYFYGAFEIGLPFIEGLNHYQESPSILILMRIEPTTGQMVVAEVGAIYQTLLRNSDTAETSW